MKSKKSQDLTLYCEYHKDSGHTTNNCISLRLEIERALKEGKLQHLLPGGQKPTKHITPHNEGTSSGKKAMYVASTHMIYGGKGRPRKAARRPDNDWKDEQVVFPKVRGGPRDRRAVVISGQLAHYCTERLFIDPGSTSDIIYEQCFNQFDQEDKDRLQAVDYPLAGFAGETVFPLGQITFPVRLTNGKHTRTEEVNFMVLPHTSNYDVLLGRESQGDFNMITSVPHSAVGFPTESGVAIIYARKDVMMTDEARPTKIARPTPVGQPEKWVLNPKHPEQKVTLGHALSSTTRAHLKQLLFRNQDIFAWTPADMTGVPREIAQHYLNTKPGIKPVIQGQRHLGSAKNQAMQEQIEELLSAGILREVKYQTWLSNPVMVEKPSGGWRMCVDYKDLNKACPKDCYALPEIDEKVDNLAPFRWKCFLDCYKGYHQVQMALEDEDKTAFRTPTGNYCYTKMPFGLRNAGSTYQKLMNDTFRGQISKSVEIYMDDLVVMSMEEDTMLTDIERTFQTLRSVNMKLNPGKCSFGMEEGKFLGFIVTKDGFKVNPEKVQAIERMPSPASMKDMQRLAGRLAALNRFLANHAAKSYPFIKTLRSCSKKEQFQWTTEAEKAFREMKECLIQLPTLTAPCKDEPLILYLSAADNAVGAVLIVERAGVQTPIYYISKMLNDPETRYSIMEKLVLALVHASRRLRRYFVNHIITVLTNYRIGPILSKPDISGRLAKWAIELGAHTIHYKPRPAIKGQILADFAAEVPADRIQECEESQNPAPPPPSSEVWALFTDGASNEEGAGAGLRLVSPDGQELTYVIRLDFKSTNNEAEYEALLAGLRLAVKIGVQHLEAHVDSLLVAGQVRGDYAAKGDIMILYLEQALQLKSKFASFNIRHINRSENKSADALSKLASTSFQHLAKEVRIEILQNPSVPLRQVSVIQYGTTSWMTPIIAYLQSGVTPESKTEARKLQYKACHYQMGDGILYRKSYLGPLLRCVNPQDATYLIREIHEGICGIHAGPRTVVAKIMNAGYYWPGMHLDAVKELRKCMDCQRHAPKTLRPKNNLVPVTTAWPFQNGQST
ncbi:putative nucleotidyltransferase, Ribonuclease H [Helianthus annuus]|nr:putative nucleotidyltransferase, Ribonuclease H [Helianthus annuus]